MTKETDYAYMAGIIDGEGTITLTRGSRHDKFRMVVVSVSNTDLSIINFMKTTFGGRTSKRTRRVSHHSDSFAWRIEGRQAISLLEKVSPFLRNEIKVDRAKHILDNYIGLTPRNGKYSIEMLERKKAFEKEFFLF